MPAATANGQHVIIATDDTSDINRSMDALRGAGIEIREISKKHATLEDAFMELIEKVD
jgi:hypothetical protein